MDDKKDSQQPTRAQCWGSSQTWSKAVLTLTQVRVHVQVRVIHTSEA